MSPRLRTPLDNTTLGQFSVCWFAFVPRLTSIARRSYNDDQVCGHHRVTHKILSKENIFRFLSPCATVSKMFFSWCLMVVKLTHAPRWNTTANLSGVGSSGLLNSVRYHCLANFLWPTLILYTLNAAYFLSHGNFAIRYYRSEETNWRTNT